MSIDMLNERSTFLKACFLVFTLNLSAMLQQSQTGTVLRRGQYCASLESGFRVQRYFMKQIDGTGITHLHRKTIWDDICDDGPTDIGQVTTVYRYINTSGQRALARVD